MSIPHLPFPNRTEAPTRAETSPGFRTKTVATRLTPGELAEVEAAAESVGRSLAEWLRETALRAARQRPADPVELLLAEVWALRYTLLNLFHSEALAAREVADCCQIRCANPGSSRCSEGPKSSQDPCGSLSQGRVPTGPRSEGHRAMLTISKSLSAGQARTYHSREFASEKQNYWSRDQQVHSEWQGRLARQWSLRGRGVGAVCAAQ